MKTDATLRQHLLKLLEGGSAHVSFEATVKDLPSELRGVRPRGLPYSAWELLEHLRIAQWDILEFSRNREHTSPQWPEGYWPATPAPLDEEAWEASVAAFRSDLRALMDLVRDEETDLEAEIPWGDGQTLLREILLVADHNAYHLGQLVTLRRLLNTWPGEG